MKQLQIRFLALLLSVAYLGPVLAADPQPYTVSLTGDAAELAATIRDSSLLFGLRETAPVPPFALIERAHRDRDRIRIVMESYGYYKPAISIGIAGKDMADEKLPDMLDAIPQGRRADVVIDVARGPLYRLGNIVIEGEIPPGKQSVLGLSEGQPAVAALVLAGQDNLQTVLQEDGYAFATVNPPIAFADDDRHVLDITYKVSAGPRVTLGDMSFVGLKTVNESFVREAVTVRRGELYRPSRVEAARRSLTELGVFSGVSVRAAEQAAADNTVGLIFEVEERKMHTVSLSANYSTDLGASGSVGWTHRNLFGNAEQLNLVAAVTGFGGNSTGGIGYDFSAQFVKPRFLEAGQSLAVELGAVKQDLDAYSQTAQNFGVHVRRELWPRWSGSVGLTATHSEVAQQGVNFLYYLAALPLALTYDEVDQPNPLIDVTSGYRLSFGVTPTLALGSSDLAFAILQISGSAYFDLTGDARTILALRGLAASIQGASNFDVPPDRRLFAGGSGTVRGFKYQSIGPAFPDGSPTGATSVDAATVELRQRIGDDWGAALFVDAGQAGTASTPFDGEVHVGAGAGVRYYTSIGAIRADIATPVTHRGNQNAFEIYIGLGQAF